MASHEWIPPETVQSTILAPDDGPSIQYLAGFWDGEGCFSCTIPNEDNKIVTFIASLSMTKESQVRMFEDRFGGSVSSYDRPKQTHSMVWKLMITDSKARILAETLFPYLIEKKRQAKIFIDAVKYKKTIPDRKYTDLELDQLSEYGKKLRSLNSSQRRYRESG